MSDIAEGLLSLAEDLLFEVDHRPLCRDERMKAEKTRIIVDQILAIDDGMKMQRVEDAARKVA
ncbi:MAG TPA: hypothetical protein VEA36_03690 [Candidatus Paceibacterota bacterium]|nr:hypothetical protein [Candidatus Paceibacterota bacterium]